MYETRTARVALFAEERVREVERHETSARRLYAAYRAWSAEREPAGALSYPAFRKAFERLAPVEGTAIRRARRGRPALVFLGVRLTAASLTQAA